MQSISNIKPILPYTYELIDTNIVLRFFENINQKDIIGPDHETTIQYEYDEYILITKYRPNLLDNINNNIDSWLNLAKTDEYNKASDSIREKRDELLKETDWVMTIDSPMSPENQEKYRIYRQELRDIPQQEGFPFNVQFPELR